MSRAPATVYGAPMSHRLAALLSVDLSDAVHQYIGTRLISSSAPTGLPQQQLAVIDTKKQLSPDRYQIDVRPTPRIKPRRRKARQDDGNGK